MAPFIALLLSFVLFRLLGLFGLAHFNDWQTSLQGAVTVMFLLTASAHWGSKRADLIRMVPPFFRSPGWIVTVTGWLEILCAIGILFPATNRVASLLLAAMLLAMFPANVRAAREGITIGGKPTPKLLVRTVLQVIFLTAVLLAGNVA